MDMWYFPNVGKGAIGVGGASGGGTVFEKDAVIGKAQMTQVTIGFQFGGQAYREVIFFEDEKTLNQFKDNKIEFSAQVSAVAAKAGASGNVKYSSGILIFTQQKGGLMYEASCRRSEIQIHGILIPNPAKISVGKYWQPKPESNEVLKSVPTPG